MPLKLYVVKYLLVLAMSHSKSQQCHASSMPLQDAPITAEHVINNRTLVTSEQIGNLNGSALSKTCQLDHAPIWLVKQYRELLSPFVAMFSKESITTGCFPAKYKNAIVTPLLKKSNLYSSLIKSYRPVSNLTFLSKFLEKVINTQLQVYLNDNEAMPKHQSAYRRYHSTETALAKSIMTYSWH